MKVVLSKAIKYISTTHVYMGRTALGVNGSKDTESTMVSYSLYTFSHFNANLR